MLSDFILTSANLAEQQQQLCIRIGNMWPGSGQVCPEFIQMFSEVNRIGPEMATCCPKSSRCGPISDKWEAERLLP